LKKKKRERKKKFLKNFSLSSKETLYFTIMISARTRQWKKMKGAGREGGVAAAPPIFSALFFFLLSQIRETATVTPRFFISFVPLLSFVS